MDEVRSFQDKYSQLSDSAPPSFFWVDEGGPESHKQHSIYNINIRVDSNIVPAYVEV